MKRESYPITDKQSWLENRLLDVTSTEVSCLFNLNPWHTEFELYDQKKNKIVQNLEDNSRMMYGRMLEDSIAMIYANQTKQKVEQFDEYMRLPELRMGSSFDYKIVSEGEPGLLEIKNVDWISYKNNWIEHSPENIQAPPHIELQLYHQMEVSGMNWGCICALVGGNDLKIVKLERDPEIAAKIHEKVKQFWDKVKAGTPPDINFDRAANYIIKNSNAEDGLFINADEDMDKLIDYYATLRRSIKKDEDELKSVKAKIFNSSLGASKIISKYGVVNCGMTKGSQGTYVTQDMVGTYINPRRAFRQFKFTQPKGAN